MAFQSTLYDDEIVIDDSHSEEEAVALLAEPEGVSRGYRREFRGGHPDEHAYGDAATPFPDDLLIPDADWEGMIKEMEDRKTRLSDLIAQHMLPCKNQQQTNFCWGNGPTHCVEIVRLKQNQETVILSPASVCAKLTGYRNVGGWGRNALLQIIAGGIVPVSLWPANAIDPRYDTAATREIALDYRIDKWWELKPRSLRQQMSCLLRRIPIAVGYNWWEHEVSLVDPIWLNGQPGGRLRNSWGMDWPKPGAGGYATVQGQKFLADDAVAPRTALAV